MIEFERFLACLLRQDIIITCMDLDSTEAYIIMDENAVLIISKYYFDYAQLKHVIEYCVENEQGTSHRMSCSVQSVADFIKVGLFKREYFFRRIGYTLPNNIIDVKTYLGRLLPGCIIESRSPNHVEVFDPRVPRAPVLKCEYQPAGWVRQNLS